LLCLYEAHVKFNRKNMKNLVKILFITLFITIMTACSSNSVDTTAKPDGMINSENPVAFMETTEGTMVLEIFADKVPETAKNFTELSKAGEYEGVPFHRVIKDFMIQGGDITTGDGYGGHSYKGPNTSIQDEFAEGLTHKYGAISMANSGPNTGGSQFFIVNTEQGTPFLDGKHAIFGQLIEGFDVLETISNVETQGADVPVKNINIKKVTILE